MLLAAFAGRLSASLADKSFKFVMTPATQRDQFNAGVSQGAPYGQWFQLGPLPDDRHFKLFHTQEALALSGQLRRGDVSLKQETLNFSGHADELFVMARAIRPHVIEVCTAINVDAANNGELDNIQTIRLM